MTRIFKSKKRFLLGVAAALTVAVAAFAYWTTSGTGDGTGQAGEDADSIVITGTVDGLMYPGGPARDVDFTAANPEDFNQSISEIQLVSVDAYVSAADRTAETNELAGCGGPNGATEDFSMANVTVAPATSGDIAPGATAQALTETGSLVMNNLDSNQDACKNAYLLLHFTSS